MSPLAADGFAQDQTKHHRPRAHEGCTFKQQFRSAAAARKAALGIDRHAAKYGENRVDAYWCRYHECWHIGHRPDPSPVRPGEG